MAGSRIRLLALGVAAFVVLVAVAAHFALPPYLEGRVEERLEEGGGVADVELRAVPALRLLAGHGDRIEVTGSGLEFDLEDADEDPFERLNKFDEVEIDLEDVEAGPFETSTFRLEGLGDSRYRIEVDATASVAEIGRVAGEQFGPLGGLIGGLAGGAVPFSNAPVPIRLEGELEAQDGDVQMTSGDADVAGLPAGPVARLVTNAILSRL
ncbi:MAG TPA: hypothetical protein VD790_06780 [Thermoleophilaceae bacterium]|nr:hypothetical protein [Thermoleophilaceae bacterium]